jgi:hypothetical protein
LRPPWLQETERTRKLRRTVVELLLAEAMARAIRTEYLQTASVKHPQLNSAYEGAAILKEKYDILSEEVRGLDAERMRAAAVQLAATALRLVVDTCPPTQTDKGKWTRGRKALDPRREKEIAAFERWQKSVEAGRGGPSPSRGQHKPRGAFRPGHRGAVVPDLESAAAIPSNCLLSRGSAASPVV